MNKNEWKEIIKAACEKAKTYKPFFDSVIDTLAQILEMRDNVHKQFVEEGCKPTIIKKTDRSQQENVWKNPLLQIEFDLNRQALEYFSHLGLTPSGLKKLNVDIVNDDKTGSFEELLDRISNG